MYTLVNHERIQGTSVVAILFSALMLLNVFYLDYSKANMVSVLLFANIFLSVIGIWLFSKFNKLNRAFYIWELIIIAPPTFVSVVSCLLYTWDLWGLIAVWSVITLWALIIFIVFLFGINAKKNKSRNTGSSKGKKLIAVSPVLGIALAGRGAQVGNIGTQIFLISINFISGVAFMLTFFGLLFVFITQVIKNENYG